MLSGEQLATTPTPPAAQARTGLAATLATAPIPEAALAIRAVRATADGSYHQILPLVRTAQRLNADDYPASKQFAPALAGRVSAQIAGSRAVRKLPDLPRWALLPMSAFGRGAMSVLIGGGSLR
jgi:hypothetical protein